MTSYYQKLSLFSCWNCHLWFPWVFHNRTVMYGSADALCRLPLFLHRWISVFEIWASNISLVYRFIQLMFIIVWTTGIWMRWHVVYTFRWMPSRITLVKQRGIYYTSSLEPYPDNHILHLRSKLSSKNEFLIPLAVRNFWGSIGVVTELGG